MDLRAVETFLVLADELHFGRTAERLGVTGGRVSQTVRELEREVGGPLFERTSRRVAITPLGDGFREGIARGHHELMQALHDAQAMTRNLRGRLRVGFLPTIGGEVVARVAAAFESAHPAARVVLSAIGIGEVFGSPEPPDGHDALLCWSAGGDGRDLTEAGLSVGSVLARVPRAVLVPAGHPLARRSRIRADELADHELLRPPPTAPALGRDLWVPRSTPSGRPLRHTAEDMASLVGRLDVRADDVMSLVARGIGLHLTVATLLDRIPFDGLVVVPIEDLPPMAAVLAWHDRMEHPLLQPFVRTAAGFAAD